MSIFGVLGSIFKPAAELVDSLHTSDDEKLQAKAVLQKLENEITAKVLDYEKSLNEAKAQVLTAEAQSPMWITAAWRPLIMIMFGVLIMLIATGLMDTEALAAVPERLWGLLQLGIGGYIAGRSAEKIVPGVITAMKAKQEV